MWIYTILSRLIDYPDEELVSSLNLIDGLLEEENDLSPREREDILQLTAWMRAQNLISLQGHYVQTFDVVPEHSLHLTHHSLGDDRARGPALADLSQYFKNDGLEPVPGELPDYLPLILEYVSTLDSMAARVFLGEAAEMLSTLAANLERSANLYAPVIRMIVRHASLGRAATRVGNLG